MNQGYLESILYRKCLLMTTLKIRSEAYDKWIA